jgi:hypothetical protein
MLPLLVGTVLAATLIQGDVVHADPNFVEESQRLIAEAAQKGAIAHRLAAGLILRIYEDRHDGLHAS